MPNTSTPMSKPTAPTRTPIISAILLALMAICLPSLSAAQSYTISPSPFQTFLDNSGNPVNLGCIWTYTAGTTTPATTYSDTSGTTNANPIIATSAGRFTAFLLPGSSYKFVYENVPCSASSHGSVLRTADNILAVPPSGAGVQTIGTYGENVTAGDVVYLSDGSGSKNAGQWYKASATNTYSSTTPEIGIAVATTTSGSTAAIWLQGRVTGLSGLTAGTVYYVAATAGQMTSTAPANARTVGQADSTTSIQLAANPPPANAPATTQTTTSTGSVNNFAATSARRLVLYANNATALTLTGLAAGMDGDEIQLIAIGAGTVTLNSLDGSSTAGNQIVTPAATNITVKTATLVYDVASTKWRVLTQTLQTMVWLATISGTTTNASAENITLAALSGLTIKDKLYIVGTWEAVTQQTASLVIYNSTDSKIVLSYNGAVGTIAAGNTVPFTATIGVAQSGTTKVDATGVVAEVTTDDTETVGAAVGYRNTVTTAWTGSWTIALRQGGVTAGGTGKYEAVIYKLLGQ